MVFPNYLFIILLILIIFIATVVIYFQIYNRHINRALKPNRGERTSMVPPFKLAAILSVIVLLFSILLSYFAGYNNAYKDYKDNAWVLSPSDVQTFYAEVKEVEGDSISVEGISLNDEKYQGPLQYDILEEQVRISHQDKVIRLTDLSNKDLISITLLTDRSGSTDVFKIQLLEDD